MAIAMLIVAQTMKLWWDAQFYDDYYPDAPLNVVIRSEEEHPAYRWVDFTFEGVPGHTVPAVMALPKDQEGPFPGLIFLHGIGQQKGFLDEIAGPFVEAGYAITSFDQYMQGERELKDANYLEQALAFRRRAALTVIETRRMVDYLQQRPDIIGDRIYLLGASYGAITGATAAAFDKRLKAALLCYGGGDPAKLIDSEVARKMLGPAVGPIKAFVSWYLAPSDPIRYIHKISPRPILFQNGRRDTIVPPASSRALIEAAREPKDVIWYDSDHVGLDPKHVETVLDDALDWLMEHDPA